MELKTNKLAHIRYTKATDFGGRKGEVTDRVIIPTYVPHDSVKAIDVSELTETDAKMLQTIMEDYTKYVEDRMTTIFSFEDWVDHTMGGSNFIESIKPSEMTVNGKELKRRTFKLANLEVIKSD